MTISTYGKWSCAKYNQLRTVGAVNKFTLIITQVLIIYGEDRKERRIEGQEGRKEREGKKEGGKEQRKD